jgi:hypothetical protein
MDRLNIMSRYQGVPNATETELRSLNDSQQHTHVDRPTTFRRHIVKYLCLVIGALWIAPIVALLVLNFQGYTIGASVWCPFGRCSFDQFGNNAFNQMKKFNEDDHNTLGTLQFVAKGLDIWFAVVATGLVFNVAMLLARSPGGLPLGHLMTHVEFKDLTYLFDPMTWRSPIPIHKHPNKRYAIGRTFLFALFAAFMCIIVNLMGPAVAVLLIPNLQWKDTPHTVDQVFLGFDSATLPLSGTPAHVCDPAQLVARNYSCTANMYASSLDSWADITLATLDQEILEDLPVWAGGSSWGISEEAAVSFTLNFTNDKQNDFINWSPDREVLRAISADYTKLYSEETGTPCEPQCIASNNSLQTILTREGPIVGSLQNTYFAELVSLVTFADIDPYQKSIRCYGDVSSADNTYDYPSWAIGKCIRVGNLWSSTNSVAQFSISSTNETLYGISVDIFFSDMATYFQGELPPCLADGQAPDNDTCDWDTIFSQSVLQASDYPFLNNLTNNVITVEMGLSDGPQTPRRINTESVAFSSIATYILDTSTSSIGMVQVDGLANPINEPHLVVNADWILAAWSSDNNGTLTQNRSSTIVLCEIVNNWILGEEPIPSSKEEASENDLQNTAGVAFIEVSIDQAMSMIGYNYTNYTTSISTTNPNSTLLSHWTQEYVWTYGLGSRTSMLGTAVAIIGILCVILQVVLQLCTHVQVRPIDELIGATLAHEPGNKFDVDENKLSKVRLKIDEDEHGKLNFEPLVEGPSRVSVHQPQNNLSSASLNSHVLPPIITGEMEHSDTEYIGA